MHTLTNFAQSVGYLFAGLGMLATVVTIIVIFASVRHKEIPETTLSKWDRREYL